MMATTRNNHGSTAQDVVSVCTAGTSSKSITGSQKGSTQHEPSSHIIDISPTVMDQQRLLDTVIDIDRDDEPQCQQQEQVDETDDVKEKSFIVSQLLLIYDLMQKVQHLRLFNGTRKQY